MKKIGLLLLLLHVFLHSKSQNSLQAAFLEAGRQPLRQGTSVMGYYAVKGGKPAEICTFTVDVRAAGNHLSVFTTLQFLNSAEQWKDTSISDIKTFKPLYRSSFSKDKAYVLHYGKDVTGYYMDRRTNKRTVVKEVVNDFFLDSYAYPYLLGSLPLTTGYKAALPVYDYKPGETSNLKSVRIQEVTTDVYRSEFTGDHKVWRVQVLEEATNDVYHYYIDKDNRRIWKIEVSLNGQQLLLVDKEGDFNPLKTAFDYAATLKMVKDGNSVIKGQAFARDNQNGGALRGMAILNVNKKQYAFKGTGIVLIPYTDYFKEWIKVNDGLRKKSLQQVPLAAGAKECIKVTTVYDDNGHFEFVNLQPGEYLLYTQFSYIHRASQTEVVGYTDTYINGIYQGSDANTETYHFNADASAFIKKVVSIKKDGEQQEIKLRKTL